ncbi:hypothetical protein [Pseudoxanthomonas composti]|uniref:hypothetical protein n=1 Tax=Pseudoxanthomonas composti TaxID=2137479 RepID=UPI001F511958|nr:hypothetical protein [Pseudoxanthomonas composti]
MSLKDQSTLASNQAHALTPQASLLPGDVLLMLGDGPLSALIAWCGDSVYSHAALVADNGELIEAAASGVRRYPIAQRLQDDKNFGFIDGFHTLAHDGQALDAADRAAIVAHAQSLIGTPYPLDSLATLGVIVAIRGKLPQHRLARLLVREALDHLVRNNPSHMVCSELVFRALAECDVQPLGRLAPTIVITPPTHLPFPEIDWVALLEEVGPLLWPKSKLKLALAAATPVDAAAGVVDEAAVAPGEDLADEALMQHVAQARAVLGLQPAPPSLATDAVGAKMAAAGPADDPRPNPKLVTPQDLAATPDHVALGRLMQAAS